LTAGITTPLLSKQMPAHPLRYFFAYRFSFLIIQGVLVMTGWFGPRFAGRFCFDGCGNPNQSVTRATWVMVS
jgi:hypothetical protein